MTSVIVAQQKVPVDLAMRHSSDGAQVFLIWTQDADGTDHLSVSVATGDDYFNIDCGNDGRHALEVFHHPMAYRP